MNYRFKNYINTASASKQTFDASIDGVRDSLNEMLTQESTPATPAAAKTGWLKGSLSYTWVVVCSLVPSLKELF